GADGEGGAAAGDGACRQGDGAGDVQPADPEGVRVDQRGEGAGRGAGVAGVGVLADLRQRERVEGRVGFGAEVCDAAAEVDAATGYSGAACDRAFRLGREELCAGRDVERLQLAVGGNEPHAVRDGDWRPVPGRELALPQHAAVRWIHRHQYRSRRRRRGERMTVAVRRLASRAAARAVVPGDDDALAVVGAVVEYATDELAASADLPAPDVLAGLAVERPAQAGLLAGAEQLARRAVNPRIKQDRVRTEVRVRTSRCRER